MQTQVILFVNNDEACLQYCREIEKYNVQLDVATELTQLKSMLQSKTYHGILLDVMAKTKGGSQDKVLLHEIVELYPTIRLRWDPGNEMIRSLLAINHDYNNDIEYFLKVQCSEFPGKTLRTHTRRDLHFNILMANSPEALKNNPIKSVTVDVSEGGCFVYSTGDWEVGEKIYFTFNEIDNDKTIAGIVRQIKDWGEKMRFPGLGVQFQEIEPSQKETIDNWRNNK